MKTSHWLWIALAVFPACGRVPADSSSEEHGANTGLRYLGGDAAQGFARAIEPREFVFPRDHASHPEYRTEWWYFTGNLESAGSRHFGFELTFFRYALRSQDDALPVRASPWATDQVWMAHFAVTDTEGGRFFARERMAREALGLAGTRSAPLRVWVKDWSAESSGERDFRLAARDEDLALALDLRAAGPVIPQGQRGLDRKGALPGNASYYYSVPRLEAQGSMTVGAETFSVEGLAWLDREWGTSSLERGIVGWDWFALNLSDERSLMFYRLRTADGRASPYSGGSLVEADGGRLALGPNDVDVVALDYWASDATGTRYPVAWRLEVRPANISLDIRPYLADQELDLSVRYWEGAVQAQGTGPNGRLTAQGYLELTGY
jgi:predicted secreted hydrolase